MNPLEDAIVALRPTVPSLPFKIPDSIRPLDPTRPLGTTTQFTGVDPATGQPVTVTNQLVDFGWEYVWHCHLLGHEENDMMRPMVFQVSPAAPSNLVAAPTGPPTGVRLTWTNNATSPAATNFYIDRATNAGFTAGLTHITVNSGTATTYTDTTVTAGTTYYYRVRAENAVSYSTWSNGVSVTVYLTPPAPTNLAATASAPPGNGPARAAVTWAESGSATVTGFTIQRATNSAFTQAFASFTAGGTARSYTLTGLLRNTRYYIRVRAVNGPTTSGWTTITVNTPR
jgi:hypothetical protein